MRDWLIEAATHHPDRVFLEVAGEAVSFGEVAHMVGEWIGGSEQALRPGSSVGIRASNDLESVVSILAAPRAGLVPLLFDPRWTAAEAHEIRIRTSTEALIDPTAGIPSGRYTRWGASHPDAIHSVVFTSGSTGTPKGVRLTWSNFEASAAASAVHLGHTHEDRWLAVLPISHVGGLGIIVRSLRQGSVVVLEPRFDASRAAALFASGEVTLGSLVAAMLRAILETTASFAGVRAVLVGGGPVPPRLVDEAWERKLPALPTYGMTETASQVATASPTSVDRHWLEPLAGAEISVMDGRIAVRGPMVSPGYLDEPDRASGEPFLTGDAGVVEGGRLRVLGRADDVIVTGGENVHPGEVEAALRGCSGVRDVAVVGIPDEAWGSIVGAVIEGEVDVEEISRQAKATLAAFKIPRRWVIVSELPRLGIGKVDAGAVQALLEGGGTG